MFFSWLVTKQKCKILGDTDLEFLAFIYKVIKTSDITIAAALKNQSLICITYNML
jgi:hypothetical protein